MKTLKRIILSIAAVMLTITLFAQTPPPPNSGGNPTNPGSGNNAVGDGVPIGGGLFILLGLGAAYGGRKLYDLRKEKLEE